MSDKQSGVFNVTLTPNEESSLLSLFNSYADQSSHISLIDFMRLCFNKQLITNLTPLHLMLKIFLQAAGDKPYFNKPRFFYAINLLSRILYKDDLFPLDPMLNLLLYTKPTSPIPLFDVETQLLLSEGILELFEKTETGFLNILLAYNTENIKKGRKVIGIQEIRSRNLGISPRHLIRYFKLKGSIFNSILTINEFQRIIQEVVSQGNDYTRKYFLYGHLQKFYEKDKETTNITKIKTILAEPELKLCDLQIAFGKIALRGLTNIDSQYDRVFELLQNKLNLITKVEIEVKYSFETEHYIPFGDIEKPKVIWKQFESNEYNLVDTTKEKFSLNEIFTTLPPYPTMEAVEKMFENDRVPLLHEEEKIQMENPPPYTLPPILHPLSPIVTEVKTPKQESKLLRSETPKLKFVQMPGHFTSKTPQKSRLETFDHIRRTLNSNLLPETFAEMSSNPSTQPSLIKEVFSLPSTFNQVSSTVDSCYSYLSKGEMRNSILSILKAKSECSRLEGKKVLKPELALFFELTLASIFESCKKYKVALAQYINTRPVFDKLSFNHPDQALLYCGLGFVLHHLGEFRLATRSYLMAKRIRERCIGGDTLETANVYNNLGVCMFSLARFQEALAYFQLAEAIMIKFLGPGDIKTSLVSQNIAKVKRQSFLPRPEFRNLWAKQFVDPFAKVKKEKKGKKKKAKK